jgi:hypothetical protein
MTLHKVDVKKDFIDILNSEVDACADSSFIMSLPTIQHGWIHGLSVDATSKKIMPHEDLTWWFVKMFAPEEYDMALRTFNAVPDFWLKLAKLGAKMGLPPSVIDWNLIFHQRRHLLSLRWPGAYDIATHAVEGKPGRASEMVRRFHTREQWQTRS